MTVNIVCVCVCTGNMLSYAILGGALQYPTIKTGIILIEACNGFALKNVR